MRIQPASTYQVRAAEKAARLLSDALTLARIARCPKLIARVHRAVTSAGGAVRHIHHRRSRTDVYGRAIDRHTNRPYPKPARRPVWFRQGQYA